MHAIPNKIVSPSISMSWSLAPWDEAVCGFPVIQILNLQVHGKDASADILRFEHERDTIGAGLVSCRLPHDHLVESMLLEDFGFRFIEMLYAPELDLKHFKTNEDTHLLKVKYATMVDLPCLQTIARTAFSNERFKMDFRLDPDFSDKRFQNWVTNSIHHSSHELYVISDETRIVSFFVTELMNDGTCYWHLNAIDPDAQGLGFGRRVWLSMLNHAARSGAQRVRTSIAARNHRVLNLYASLGFKFLPPSMTFHWIRKSFVHG